MREKKFKATQIEHLPRYDQLHVNHAFMLKLMNKGRIWTGWRKGVKNKGIEEIGIEECCINM